MPNTELIFYPSGKALRANIPVLLADETVVRVDLETPDPVLRVTRVDGYEIGQDSDGTEKISDPEPETASEAGETAPLATEEPEKAPEVVETENATESGEEDAEEIDLEKATRDQLRQIVADYALEVEVPDNGPLAPVRAAVAAALN